MTLKTGIYRHDKGNRDQVLPTARHSDSVVWLVVYRVLYGDYGVWVRPLTMFCESVTIDGKTLPRFELVKELS